MGIVRLTDAVQTISNSRARNHIYSILFRVLASDEHPFRHTLDPGVLADRVRVETLMSSDYLTIL